MIQPLDALERLGRLLDDGKITRQEFDHLKQSLLIREPQSVDEGAPPSDPKKPAANSHHSPGDHPLLGESEIPAVRWASEIGRKGASVWLASNPRRALTFGWWLIGVGLIGIFISFNMATSSSLLDTSLEFWFVELALRSILNPLVWIGLVGAYIVRRTRDLI